jgi:hypothetical protein
VNVKAKIRIPNESVVMIRNFTPQVLGPGAMDGIESWTRKIVKRAAASMHNAPHPGEPSAPGTPPNIQSGLLHDNMKVVRSPLVVRVSMPFYGQIHEQGGTKHPARPFIMPQVKADPAGLQKELKKGLANGPVRIGTQQASPFARTTGVEGAIKKITRELGKGVSVTAVKKQWGGTW